MSEQKLDEVIRDLCVLKMKVDAWPEEIGRTETQQSVTALIRDLESWKYCMGIL